LLVDDVTGEVLFEKAAHERRPMASTTKIMTGLLLLERGRPQELVTISPRASDTSGSSLFSAGEQLKLADLLKAILINSDNDAAVAAAEHVAGSEAAFVELMNRRARKLGARDTHFENPHGLYHPDHYSSAYDLGLIAREAMRNSRFRQLVTTRRASIPGPNGLGKRELLNHNKLLEMSQEADGIKTGFVRQSGRCLVASARREGWRLIAVLLNSAEPYEEALALFDYGFSNFELRYFARRGKPVGRARVRGGRVGEVGLRPGADLAAVAPRGQPRRLHLVARVKRIVAPVNKDQVLGTLRLEEEGKVVAEAPLLAERAVALSLPRTAWRWGSRALIALALLALGVRTSAKIAKAYRRRRPRLPPRGGSAHPRRAGCR
jgi:D-alanyl-D-alanine carboxypeptidase (penicillin-binding protein 5/6)